MSNEIRRKNKFHKSPSEIMMYNVIVSDRVWPVWPPIFPALSMNLPPLSPPVSELQVTIVCIYLKKNKDTEMTYLVRLSSSF